MTTETITETAAIPLTSVGDIWFRYRDQAYSTTVDPDRELYSTTYQLELESYVVLSITKKGVWLAHTWDVRHAPGDPPALRTGSTKRFVLAEAGRRHAHPTKAEALKAFAARKARQQSILQHQLERVRYVRSLALAQLDIALDPGQPSQLPAM